METQQRQLEELLTQEGWSIVSRDVAPDEWWLDEVWMLESAWTPTGKRLFVSFLVDPQAMGDRVKGQAVWAVAATLTRPTSRQQAQPPVPLRPHWERHRRDEIISNLRRLRGAEPGVSNREHP